MAKRQKNAGGRAPGRDPMIGVRLPAAMIKKIGKIAEALSTNRSGAIRWLPLKSEDNRATRLGRDVPSSQSLTV